MILKHKELMDIRSGRIKLAFRKWRRPSVKARGTLRTEIGVIRIVTLDPVTEKSITNAEAKKAGYPDRDSLLSQLSKYSEGKLFRIGLKYESEDPRIDLREKTTLSADDLAKLMSRLERLDRSSRRGPWTRRYLKLIDKFPERRAGDLADMIGMDKFDFKINVRKLKNLGLTISHEIGYSISPLGNFLLQNWRHDD